MVAGRYRDSWQAESGCQVARYEGLSRARRGAVAAGRTGRYINEEKETLGGTVLRMQRRDARERGR